MRVHGPLSGVLCLSFDRSAYIAALNHTREGKAHLQPAPQIVATVPRFVENEHAAPGSQDALVERGCACMSARPVERSPDRARLRRSSPTPSSARSYPRASRTLATKWG